MRMTDHLLTETPRPCLDDKPLTDFATLCPDPVVIDATDVYALFIEMTFRADATKTDDQLLEERLFEESMGTAGWQMAQFFQFDFTTLGVVAPPFDNFVIEFHMRDAMTTAMADAGMEPRPTDFLHVGQIAAAFTILEREVWDEQVSTGAKYAHGVCTGPSLKEMDALDFRWMYCITTYRMSPGKGLVGPCSTWLIPVNPEGRLYPADNHETLMASYGLGPKVRYADDEMLSDQYAITQGWQVVIPALMALNFLHTPRTTKDREGYHDLIESSEPHPRMARKYLAKHFRPLTRWHTLDIGPLRQAVKRANGGRMPTDWKGLAKALHVVRGHARTYMPNTYFGKKHDRPITVFIPSYKRGDIKSGIIQKEYRLDSGEESA